ncbi:MAG: integration host factor subunit alpha [Thermodesulfovibrionia bacterium]
MIKADLANRLYERLGLPKRESAEIVELLFDTLSNTLAEGESVKISGFGTFLVRKKGTRKGRNPKTGEEIQITQRRVVTFKPSHKLKDIVEKA